MLLGVILVSFILLMIIMYIREEMKIDNKSEKNHFLIKLFVFIMLLLTAIIIILGFTFVI